MFTCRFVVPCFGEGDKTNKRKNEIPFLRFGDFNNTTKRTNEEMKFCFGVLSFVLVKESYLILYSQLILKYFHKAQKRHNENAKKGGFTAISFYRFYFVASYKSPKRRNEISFWRLVVLSPSIRHQNEQTKWPYPASIIFSLCSFELCKFLYG